LGGWLASVFGWRVIFYINLPVGLVAIWLSYRFIPHDSIHKIGEQFDIPGALTFLFGLGGLLLGLNQGNEWGWTSLPTVGLLIGAIVLLAVFIYIELHSDHPMLDLSLFRRPAFSLIAASAVFNYIGVFCALFLMPFYLIQARGFSAAQAGLILTAQPLVMAVVAPFSGTLSDRIGTRIPAVFGMAVLSTGLFLLSRLGPQSDVRTIMLSLAVLGLGTGVFVSPNNSALMGSAPRNRQGIAAGILATARNFGMVLGVGIAAAVFTTVLAHASSVPVSSGNLTQNGGLYTALEAGFLTCASISLAGVLTSLVRIRK
jgi:predicted MFS family arabinose efflux permease